VASTKSTWLNRCAGLFLRCLVILVLSGVMIAATPLHTKRDFEGPVRYSSQEIRRAITFYAKRYRLDPALLRAVIKTESDFRQDAVSRKGAVGLMQLTPDTAATLRVADVYDPLQNIRGGAKQLRHLLNLYEGDLPLALAAYNAGVHRVKGGQIPRIRETRSYVRKVLRYYEQYRGTPRCKRLVDAASCKIGFGPHTSEQGGTATNVDSSGKR
jgi:hypothetical protein